jgi:hypothetical protein
MDTEITEFTILQNIYSFIANSLHKHTAIYFIITIKKIYKNIILKMNHVSVVHIPNQNGSSEYSKT